MADDPALMRQYAESIASSDEESSWFYVTKMPQFGGGEFIRSRAYLDPNMFVCTMSSSHIHSATRHMNRNLGRFPPGSHPILLSVRLAFDRSLWL